MTTPERRLKRYVDAAEQGSTPVTAAEAIARAGRHDEAGHTSGPLGGESATKATEAIPSTSGTDSGSSGPRRGRLVALAAAVLVILSGTWLIASQPDSDTRVASGSGEPAADCTRYALFRGEGWSRQELVDYPKDLGTMGLVLGPHLDWYSEFERFTRSWDDQFAVGTSFTISGHATRIDDLVLQGVELQEHGGGSGLRSIPRSEGHGSIVAKPISDSSTLVFSSNGLTTDELVRIAGETRSVCPQEWLDAGGVVLECMPGSPGCAVPPPNRPRTEELPPPPAGSPTATTSVPSVGSRVPAPIEREFIGVYELHGPGPVDVPADLRDVPGEQLLVAPIHCYQGLADRLGVVVSDYVSGIRATDLGARREAMVRVPRMALFSGEVGVYCTD